jgi:hypothetical protein
MYATVSIASGNVPSARSLRLPPAPPPTGARYPTAIAVLGTIGAVRAFTAVAVGALGVAVAACAPGEGDPHSVAEIEQAISAAGLVTCATDGPTPGPAGTPAVISLDVAVGTCDGGPPGRLVLATHESSAARDRVLRGVVSQTRPRFADAVWTFGTTTVLLSGPTSDEVVSHLQDAMAALGA